MQGLMDLDGQLASRRHGGHAPPWRRPLTWLITKSDPGLKLVREPAIFLPPAPPCPTSHLRTPVRRVHDRLASRHLPPPSRMRCSTLLACAALALLACQVRVGAAAAAGAAEARLVNRVPKPCRRAVGPSARHH